jgi:hypothetical protein
MASYTMLSRWVRDETLPHAELLTTMRQRLTKALDPQIEPDGDGRDMVIPADVTPAGAPDRNWCRGYQEYRSGFKILIEEQRARDQMILMARNKSTSPMTDEEYLSQMAEMMAEAISMVSREDLVAELKRRGMKEPKESK